MISYFKQTSFSFICYLAVTRPNLGQYRSGSLTPPILVAGFCLCLSLYVCFSLVMRLGPKTQPNAQWGLNRKHPNPSTTSQPTRPLSPRSCNSLIIKFHFFFAATGSKVLIAVLVRCIPLLRLSIFFPTIERVT